MKRRRKVRREKKEYGTKGSHRRKDEKVEVEEAVAKKKKYK